MKVCLQKNAICISENNSLAHVNDVINVTVYIFFNKSLFKFFELQFKIFFHSNLFSTFLLTVNSIQITHM